MLLITEITVGWLVVQVHETGSALEIFVFMLKFIPRHTLTVAGSSTLKFNIIEYRLVSYWGKICDACSGHMEV
jgi:hypothetical protein